MRHRAPFAPRSAPLRASAFSARLAVILSSPIPPTVSFFCRFLSPFFSSTYKSLLPQPLSFLIFLKRRGWTYLATRTFLYPTSFHIHAYCPPATRSLAQPSALPGGGGAGSCSEFHQSRRVTSHESASRAYSVGQGVTARVRGRKLARAWASSSKLGMISRRCTTLKTSRT